MQYLAIFIISLTAVRLIVALLNLAGRQWLRRGSLQSQPKVSVLIPARNEENNIANILENVLRHDYRNLEIIVYDDMSEDNTRMIAKTYRAKDNRINVIYGKALPEGWLGKNYACHLLSMEARGEYVLFIDADVHIKKGVIKNAVAHMQRHKLALLSLFPVQKMITFPEKIFVPAINWILTSLLPLALTRKSSRPSLSAANGQFMLFDAKVYHKEKFHKAMRNKPAEDISIFRLMKKKKYKVQTLLGNSKVSCRMYQSGHEAVQGLAKNVFEYFGGSPLAAFLFGFITTFGFIPVVLKMPVHITIIYFSMIILMRLIISTISRQNIFWNLLLAPLQQAGFFMILIKALIFKYRKNLLWKGRNIY